MTATGHSIAKPRLHLNELVKGVLGMKHVVMDPETGDVIATYQNVAGMWRFYERSASYLAQDLGAGRPTFDQVVLDAHRAKGRVVMGW